MRVDTELQQRPATRSSKVGKSLSGIARPASLRTSVSPPFGPTEGLEVSVDHPGDRDHEGHHRESCRQLSKCEGAVESQQQEIRYRWCDNRQSARVKNVQKTRRRAEQQRGFVSRSLRQELLPSMIRVSFPRRS